ncbi:MAG: tetratricopeptide repeat protein [Leptolyngbyaceae bacterium]|nr:tetratricopeptide repeat protein [Leptolyngbyaceae bacterium]
MVTLSLCMIVKNEAARLAACLESACSFVDEIVILDTGSTDATVEIAKQFNAVVEFHPWNNDFAEARNIALQFVTSDWVLVLDADERLTSDIAPQLRHVIAREDDCLVVNLVRQEIGAAQSPYSLVSRLFRNHPDVRFTRPYHAMVDDSVAELLNRESHWKIQELSGVAILHDGYQAEAIANRNKLQNARLTMERYLSHHPGDPYVCSKLGALYVELGRPTYGIELLERGLKATPLEAPVAYELHYHLGIVYSKMKCVAQALHHYEQAIKQPILPALKLGAYNNLGSVRQATGDVEEARLLFEQAIAIDPKFAKGHFNLGMVLKQSGQMTGAIASYQHAIQLQPDYAEAHQNLGVALLKMGQVTQGIQAFQQAIRLHEDKKNLHEAQRLREGLEGMGFKV